MSNSGESTSVNNGAGGKRFQSQSTALGQRSADLSQSEYSADAKSDPDQDDFQNIMGISCPKIHL